MGSVSIKSVLSLAFAFGLASSALTASAAPKCSAVYDAATTTLTLYYDEVDHSSEGAVYALPAAKPDWPADFKNATTIVFDSSFHNWKPSSCTQWFYLFTKASSFVGIENWDVSECTNMRRLFCKCPVTILDLSTFETGKCTAFNEMFSSCGNLVTIYASANFDTSKGTTFDKMFDSCTKLVGGNNTKFDAANDYKTYARIDLPGQPGYFTGKDVPLPPTIESVDFTDLTHESVTIITKGKNINGGSVMIELWAGEKVAEKSLDDFGSAAFAELTPETTYTVKVTAKNEYGSVTDESCSFTTQPLPVPTISGVTVDTVLHDTVMLTVSGESIADVEVKVELLEGDEIRATKTGEAFGEFVIEGLTPETTYTVKVTATNKYGSKIDESASFTTLEKPADEWTYTVDESTGAGTVAWGGWTFAATVADGTHDLSVGACTGWPTVITPLDFGRKVVGRESGEEYTIVSLSPAFSHLKGSDLVGKDQGGFVGVLTLPSMVTNIGAHAFGYCTNSTGVIDLPSTLRTLGDYAFAKSGLTFNGADFANIEKIPAYGFKGTKVSGEANLANATSVTKGAFEGVSSLKSVKFGPKLTSLYGDYNHGAFHDCSGLTNVTFDAESRFMMSGQNVFAGCNVLKKIDLCGVTSMTVAQRGDYKATHFKGCVNLAEIDFGPALTNLDKSAVSIDSANLKTIVFEGKVPDVFGTPYLWGAGQTNTLIKTYIHSSMRSKKNAAGKCWRDYAANGEISAPKKDSSKNTTFAVDYIEVDLDGTASKRQLLTLEPDSGLILLVK